MADFDCTEFIDVAETIATGANQDQAHLRTIVGRSYYGAYGYVRRRLVSERNTNFGGSGRHTALRDACVNATTPRLQTLGQALKELLALRVRADYEWAETENITLPEAIDSTETARDAADEIRQLDTHELQTLHHLVKVKPKKAKP